ncbi:MAG: hypothetical protein LBB60_07985 [Desulfovibrio sp.]|jgi:hypothetical protein|nr:hypothetical protein [Desulfovibrio sp.]
MHVFDAFVHGISRKWEGHSLLCGFIRRLKETGGFSVFGACTCAACSSLKEIGYMEKETRTWNEATWKDTAEKAASSILLHSRDRMIKVEGPYQPEHKAYMSLALAASEAIRAFLALDESMK